MRKGCIIKTFIHGISPFCKSRYPYKINSKYIDTITAASQGTGKNFFPIISSKVIKRKIDRYNFNRILILFVESLNNLHMRRRNIIHVVKLPYNILREYIFLKWRIKKENDRYEGNNSRDQPDRCS